MAPRCTRSTSALPTPVRCSACRRSCWHDQDALPPCRPCSERRWPVTGPTSRMTRSSRTISRCSPTNIAGRPYSKAEHNRLLQAMIGRPRGSIEYKHQNISAVLKGLGEDWIPGYKPAFNFQASLVDAVVRWLKPHPDWLAPAARMGIGKPQFALREEAILWIGPPPLPTSVRTFSMACSLKARMVQSPV